MMRGILGGALLLAGVVLVLISRVYRFAGIVVCGIGALVLLFWLLHTFRLRFPRLTKHLRRILLCCIALGVLVTLATGVWLGTTLGGADDPAAEYVVVLGAGVNGTIPSQALRERLDTALDYLQRNPAAIAILSGGQGSGEDISEAACMFAWLTARGISSDRLRMEDAATNTQENLRFSLDLIEEETGARPQTVAVVSSEYHLLRAEIFADKQGVAALGVPARTNDRFFFCYMFVREICGIWAALLFG